MRTPLLVRYGTTKDGAHAKVADIYTVSEHGITRDKIDPEALKITDRLNQEGFEAYIVGGAVRDLLLGKRPKDFDIATNALPRKVRKIFRHSRIIGKRFRLVHVQYGKKILEVSTFRSGETGEDNNIYGTLEEDVKRRDFTCNALYYSPKEQYILDYVGGFSDIKKGKLRSLIPLPMIFQEDPARMIRAVKYAVSSGFVIPFPLKRKMKREAVLLERISPSRLTEELLKILQSGYSREMFISLLNYDLLQYFLPWVNNKIKPNTGKALREAFWSSLKVLDLSVQENQKELSKGRILFFLFSPFIDIRKNEAAPEELVKEAFKKGKEILHPLTPPNADIEEGVRWLCKSRGIRLPRLPGKYKKRSSPESGHKRAG